jgi:signal peptidase II
MTTPQDSAGDAPPAPALRRLLPWTLLLAAGVVAVDQLTKWWAESTLVLGRGVPVLGELVQWRLHYNPGAALGLASGSTWLLTVVAAVAVVALTVFATRVTATPWAVGVGMLLGGATTHLGDRLLRPPGFARGHVVDFIDYGGLFIGNVADIALVGGAAFLVLLTLLGVEPGRRPA